MHRRADMEAPVLDAPSYVIEAPDDEDEITDFNPVIIAETTTSLKRLSVSEAVMELDMTGATAGVPPRLQRPGQYGLPPRRRQCRLGRSAGALPPDYMPQPIDAREGRPYGPPPSEAEVQEPCKPGVGTGHALG